MGAIAMVAAFGACGESVADDGPAEATTTSVPQTCTGSASAQGSDRVVADELAERLPPPPPGARACRVDYRTRTTQYVGAPPEGDRQLLRYYRRALQAENCSTEDLEAASGDLSAAGSLALPFECPEGEGTIVATRSGATYSIAWRA